MLILKKWMNYFDYFSKNYLSIDHNSFSFKIIFGIPLTIGYSLKQLGQINLPSKI